MRRVVRVTVAVRINRPLEPGDELIGTAVDLVGAARVALPARHPDGQDRGPRRNAAKSRRPDDDPGQLRSVALELGAVSYTHLRAHETVLDLVCRLLLEKKK